MNSSFLGNLEATVLSGIASLAETASAIDVAVSYVQVSGWKSVRPLVRPLPPGSVRVVFTDQFDLTHPNALKLAITDKVAIRRYVGSAVYHPKVYIARDNSGAVQAAVVGSANLSGSGLESGVEGAILIRGAELLSTVGTWFERLWNDAEPIDAGFVRQYRGRWRTAARARIRMRRFRSRTTDRPTAAAMPRPEDVDVLERTVPASGEHSDKPVDRMPPLVTILSELIEECRRVAAGDDCYDGEYAECLVAALKPYYDDLLDYMEYRQEWRRRPGYTGGSSR